MDEESSNSSRGVSPYLQNPNPFFAPGSEKPGNEEAAASSSSSIDPEEVAEIRKTVSALLVFGFHGTKLNAHARNLINMGARGVILFNRNFRDPEQVAKLCLDLKREAHPRPLLIMVDHKGGYVRRLGLPFIAIPHARVVGDTGNPWAAAVVASVIGR